jgi:hypothetical protein
MMKVMEMFVKHFGLDINGCRFHFGLSRVRGDETPRSLELEDGDVIAVILEQSGC